MTTEEGLKFARETAELEIKAIERLHERTLYSIKVAEKSPSKGEGLGNLTGLIEGMPEVAKQR